MGRIMYCPFLTVDYRDKKGMLRIRCEMAVIDFADGEEMEGYICRHCGSMSGWKECSIAKSRLRHYEKEDGKRGK